MVPAVPYRRRLAETFPEPAPDLQRLLLVDDPMRPCWPEEMTQEE